MDSLFGGGSNASTIDPRVYANVNANYQNAFHTFAPNTGGWGSTTPAYSSLIGQGYPAGTGEFTADPSANTKLASAILTGDWGYPGAMQAGQGALTGAQDAAQGLLNYQAPQATAAWSGNYDPAAINQTNAAWSGNYAPAALTQGTAAWTGNYNPAATETAAAPQLPTGQGFGAASINRGDIANITPQAGLGGLASYMNPYTQNVIDTSLNDLNRARQLGINSNASNATLSNAFGGDRQGVADAETNRGYLDAAARTIAGLRNQGFDTASGLLQNDQARNLQAQLANQGADLNVAGLNTGYGQQAGMFNANAANQAQQFGAGLLANLNQYNAGALNQGNQFNASNLMQNNQFNAGNQQAINLANMSAANQLGQFNAGNLLQSNMFNAGNQQQANLANMAALNQGGQFNASNLLQNAQFNAGNQQQTQLANLDAALRGAGINLSASGLLGNLGTSQLQNYLAGAGAIGQTGATEDARQMAYRQALYQDWLRQQQYPLNAQELVNQSLGLMQGGSRQGSQSGGLLGLLGPLLMGAAL